MASQPASLVPASQLDSTFGCLFVAGIISSMLWAVGCLQLYLYYEKYWTADRSLLKTYVALTWMVDTSHQVLTLVYVYGVFVKGIVDPTRLFAWPKTVTNTGTTASIVDFMVQLIFLRRAWYLSQRNVILTGVLLFFIIGQFVMNMTYTGLIWNEKQLTGLSKHLNMELALNCVIAFTDTLLAGVLIWLLWQSRSGFHRSDSIINRLVAYTVGSGLVTSVWMIAAVIAIAAAKDTLIYAISVLSLPKLYFNCMLASLNARSSLRGMYSQESRGGLSIQFEDLSTSVPRRANLSTDDDPHKTSRPRVIECRVDIDVDSNEDQRKVAIGYPSSYSDSVTTKP